MAQRCRVYPRQRPPTAAAGRGLEGDNGITLLGGQKGTHMAGMAGLTTGRALRRRFAAWWLGVRVFRTGRPRGIPGRLVQASFQLVDLGQERANDGLRFGRLSGNQFFRNLQRHALYIAEKQAPDQTDSRKTSPRVVTDYGGGEPATPGGSGPRCRRPASRASGSNRSCHSRSPSPGASLPRGCPS